MRHRFREARKFLSFAFYPKATLIACTVFFAVVIAILAIVMKTISTDSPLYDVIFALTTGAAGSFFVSIIVELANNYRHNKLSWYELQDYYSVVMDYETSKQVMVKNRAEQSDKDVVEVVWHLLPRLIPVLERTLNEKKTFLSDDEIDELQLIFSEYKQIQVEIRKRVFESPMYYDTLNHPDENYLKSTYPEDVYKYMPDWIRQELARKESQRAIEQYVEVLLSDRYLLSEFMKDYDISQNGIDAFQGELQRMEQEEEEAMEREGVVEESEELDFSQPDDEEEFRAQVEECEKQMELEHRPFVSWHISMCCLKISDSMDVLEKLILKKPYYGTMIKYVKKTEMIFVG